MQAPEVVFHREAPTVAFRSSATPPTKLGDYDHGYLIIEAETRGIRVNHPAVLLGFEFNSLVDFFAELAQDWRGWSGTRDWRSLEGDLAISATSDDLGHCHLIFEIADGPLSSWSAKFEGISIDAGEDLNALARSLHLWSETYR